MSLSLEDEILLDKVTKYVDSIIMPFDEQFEFLRKIDALNVRYYDDLIQYGSPKLILRYLYRNYPNYIKNLKSHGKCVIGTEYFDEYEVPELSTIVEDCHNPLVLANNTFIEIEPETFENYVPPYNRIAVFNLTNKYKNVKGIVKRRFYHIADENLDKLNIYQYLGFSKFSILDAIEKKIPDIKNRNFKIPASLFPDAPQDLLLDDPNFISRRALYIKSYIEEIYRNLFNTQQYIDWRLVCNNPDAYVIDTKSFGKLYKNVTGNNLNPNITTERFCQKMLEGLRLKEEIEETAQQLIYQPGSRWVDEPEGFAPMYGPENVKVVMREIKNLCSEGMLEETDKVDLIDYTRELGIELPRLYKTYTKEDLCRIIKRHLELI